MEARGTSTHLKGVISSVCIIPPSTQYLPEGSTLSLQQQDTPLPQARVCSVLLARRVWFGFLNNAVFYFH